MEGVRTARVPHCRITLHVAHSSLEVRTPPRHIASPCGAAKALFAPHRQGHVWILPSNDHLALLTVCCPPPRTAFMLCNHHVSVDPWQRPTSRIWAERLAAVCVVTASPHDAPVLCGPIAVDVVSSEVGSSESVHSLIHRLGAEDTET